MLKVSLYCIVLPLLNKELNINFNYTLTDSYSRIDCDKPNFNL